MENKKKKSCVKGIWNCTVGPSQQDQAHIHPDLYQTHSTQISNNFYLAKTIFLSGSLLRCAK